MDSSSAPSHVHENLKNTVPFGEYIQPFRYDQLPPSRPFDQPAAPPSFESNLLPLDCNAAIYFPPQQQSIRALRTNGKPSPIPLCNKSYQFPDCDVLQEMWTCAPPQMTSLHIVTKESTCNVVKLSCVAFESLQLSRT